MKRKLLIVILAAVGCIACGFGFAACSDEGLTKNIELEKQLENYYFQNTVNGYEITGVKDLEIREAVIPEGVTSIAQDAFSGCVDLKSIIIPEGVTSIGSSAFYRCYGLRNVVIPLSMTFIDSSAFSDCSLIETATLPPMALSSISKEYLKTAVFLGSEEIPNGAFSGCRSLTSVTFPDSVTSIGDYAFNGCSSLKNFEIPDGVTSIGDYAFRNCSILQGLKIPDSVTSIGRAAFEGCTNLIQTENGVHYIDEWVVGSNAPVSEVTIRNNTKKIADFAFEKCGLRSVVFPDGLTSIGSYVFRLCYYLRSVTIPNSVTSIGTDAFDDSDLSNIYYNGTNAQWVALLKSSNLDKYINNYIVYCTDGIVINGTIRYKKIITKGEIL